jgi:hypothetical protein
MSAQVSLVVSRHSTGSPNIRTVTHGMAASCGQLGALTSTLVFTYGSNGAPLSPQNIFIVNGFAALAGLLVTIIFIPDTIDLSLHEVDRLWECKLLNKPYEGPALEADNLSYFELAFMEKRKSISSEDKEIHKQPQDFASEPKAENGAAADEKRVAESGDHANSEILAESNA